MATPAKKTKAKPTVTKNGNEVEQGIYRWAIIVIDKIGINGFLIVTIVSIFLGYATKAQKETFISKYILLEFKKQELPQAVAIVLFLVVAYVITLSYYAKRAKLDKKRIQTLEADLNELKNSTL